MLTRKLGQLVRGKTTPFQLFTAALLGTALGFLPGIERAPGLFAAIGAVLLVLNANLFVAALCFGLGKLLGLVLLKPAFEIGRVLIDDVATGLFRKLVNLPLVRFFGFEHYAVTGGLVLGLAVGAGLGLVLALAQARLRSALAGLEEGSEKFQQVTSKGWVKFLTWLFVGKKKDSYEELGAKRVGLPVRPVGLVAVVVLAGGAFAADALLSSKLMAGVVRKGLERANGATVDLEGFQLAPRSGRLAVDRLAMADRLELGSDLFRGLAFEADLSVSELLRGRVVVERLSIREATSGAERDTPGEVVGPDLAEEQDDGESGGFGLPKLDELDLDEVIADVERWKATLEKVQRMLGRLAGDEDANQPEPEPGTAGWRERLEREAAASGLADVVASHLFPAEPRFHVREIVVEDFRFAQVAGEPLDLRIADLSSSPVKLGRPASLALATRDETLSLAADLGAAPTLALRASGLSVDRIAGDLSRDGERLVRGGTIDFELNGLFDARAGRIDLPLEVRLDGTELFVPNVGATQVADFRLPVGLRGPIGSPRVSVDDEDLVASLLAAGQEAFANRVQAEVDVRVAEAKAQLRAELTQRYGDELTKLGIDLDAVDDLDDLEALATQHLGAPLAAFQDGSAVDAVSEAVAEAVDEATQEVTDQATEALTEEAGELLSETIEGLGEGKLPDLENLGEGSLGDLEKLGDKLGGDLGEKAKEQLGGKLGNLFGKQKP